LTYKSISRNTYINLFSRLVVEHVQLYTVARVQEQVHTHTLLVHPTVGIDLKVCILTLVSANDGISSHVSTVYIIDNNNRQ